MEALLRKLNTIPEAAELAARVEDGGCPMAVTGLAAVHRAQIGAAVALATGRPAVFVCGDEREAHALAGDLAALTETQPVLLLAREWNFRPNAIVSRGWEQSRLAALYALTEEKPPVVVATVDGLMARTMPPELLRQSALELTVGGRVDLNDLPRRLVAAGYTRCDQVEGVGQFAVRGGILDVFSPLMEEPVRCEFFDDEIDSLGAFDTATQRRTRNLESARILPAAEILPHAAKGGLAGLADALDALAGKMARRQKTDAAAQTVRDDASRLRDGVIPGGMDRYLTLIHPEAACGVDYLTTNLLE